MRTMMQNKNKYEGTCKPFSILTKNGFYGEFDTGAELASFYESKQEINIDKLRKQRKAKKLSQKEAKRLKAEFGRVQMVSYGNDDKEASINIDVQL